MDQTVRVFANLKEMKAEEYRYWQQRPVHERMAAVAEITLSAYGLKGSTNVPRLQRTPVCLQRPQKF
jgi:hypothetical protein